MELGVWGIIKEYPSLIGLIPMVLYIILAFKKGIDPVIPLLISIVIGWLLTGNGATVFGQEVGTSLSSVLGQVGFLSMEGAGLGIVLKEAGVSATLCKLIANKLGVKTQKQALITLMVCQFILATCVGSGVSAAAIVMPVLLPMLALTGVTPVAATVAFILSGLAGMLLAPFAAPNIMAMSLTGLSYPQYLLWGAGPYLIVMLITAVILSFWIDKKAKKDPNGEKYELSDAEKDMTAKPTQKEKITTIAFIVTFALCIAYAIAFRQGMAFVIFVLPFLAVVVAVFSRMGVNKACDAFYTGCKNTISVFIICVLYQLLVDVVNVAGGFEALSNLFLGLVGSSPSKSTVMLMGTFVGAFGVNGGAAAQMQIIHELFLPMIQQNGLGMGLWSIVLVAGSYVTSIIYPNATVLAPMGIARSKDFKNMMICMWISSAIIMAFCVLYCFIMPMIF